MSFKKINELDKNRPDGKNCIVVYGYDKESTDKINEYKSIIGINHMIEVKDEYIDEVILNIVEENFDKENLISNNKTESLNAKAIIFNAVSQFELNNFVKDFKNLGIDRPLFAMVTKTSIVWKFKDLVKELQSEREELSKAFKK